VGSEMCIRDRYSDEEGEPMVLSENVLVLKEPSGTIRAIPLYTKKQ